MQRAISIALFSEISQRRQNFAIEELIVQGQMEAVDAKRVKLSHPLDDGGGASDETARISFIAVEEAELVVGGPHPARARGLLDPARNDGWIDRVDHPGDFGLGFRVGGAAERDRIDGEANPPA